MNDNVTEKQKAVQWFDDVIAGLQQIVDRNDQGTIPGNARAAAAIAKLKALRDEFISKP